MSRQRSRQSESVTPAASSRQTATPAAPLFPFRLRRFVPRSFHVVKEQTTFNQKEKTT
jgi:hypothetical protein